MAGLLDFLQNPATMNLAASLLSAGGPSRTPISTGQALGSGLLSYQQGIDQDIQRKLMDRQIKKLIADQELEQKQEQSWQNIGSRNPEDLGFSAPQGLPWSDLVNMPDMRKQISKSMFPSSTDNPSNVREWEYYSKLPDEEKQQFLSMKRASQNLNLGDRFITPSQVAPGQIEASYQKGLPPQDLPSVKGAQEAAKQGAQLTYAGPIAAETASGKIQGEATTTASIDLPKTVQDANETIRLIDDLLKHPGLKQAVGTSSVMGVQKIPGTDAYSFMTRLDQLKGKQFMQAYQGLKGGGQITEVEGKKATDAMSRMDNANSEEEFVTAAREFQGIVKVGVDRAKEKAGVKPNGLPSIDAIRQELNRRKAR